MGTDFWFRNSNEKFIESFQDKKYYPELEKDPENNMSGEDLIDYKNQIKLKVDTYFKDKGDKWLFEESKLYPKLRNIEIIFM